MEKSEYVMIVASDIDICWNALLHDANDETSEKYTIYSLKYVILFSCVLANFPKINLNKNKYLSCTKLSCKEVLSLIQICHCNRKQDEEKFVFLHPDENTCQRTSANSIYSTTAKQVTIIISVKNLPSLKSLNLVISFIIILHNFPCVQGGISFEMINFISIMTLNNVIEI